MNSVQIDTRVAGDGLTYAKKGDRVALHYIGKLRNGSVFDSTYIRKKPFQFTIGNDEVIPGLEYVVKQLSLGERAVADIPSSLAFKTHCIQGLIPPNADITFDVELTSIDNIPIMHLWETKYKNF